MDWNTWTTWSKTSIDSNPLRRILPGLEFSDLKPEKRCLPESTWAYPDLKIAGELKDSTGLYAYSNSGQRKLYPLGVASNLLRPLVLRPKPANYPPE